MNTRSRIPITKAKSRRVTGISLSMTIPKIIKTVTSFIAFTYIAFLNSSRASAIFVLISAYCSRAKYKII